MMKDQPGITNALPQPEPISRLEQIGQIRACLVDLLPDAETLWNQSNDATIAFRGHLALDADQTFPLLKERFAELGYTPLLRRQDEFDIVVAIRHVFKPKKTHWIVNLILFLLTVCTTTIMGALMEQGDLLVQNPRLLFQKPALVLSGVPASLTIMGILGVHELAHFFVARRHGLDSSLPYFIPVPFGFGTFGAIIRIRMPWENRKALFDVGIAGPLAGFLVALPLFFVGLLMSPAMPPLPDGVPLGSPFLLQWVEKWVYAIRDIPPDHDIYVNAMTFAAWFGLVVTGFNLLPIGQLDGGHVIFAVLGRWAQIVGIVALVALFALGTFVWSGWYMWAAFIMFSGWRHPPPLNTVAPLGKVRTLLGIAVLVLTVLLFTPSPFPV
jgi:membrane-associated protease RseP (regulator of RpoE activity)